ncbi:ATP-binding cassette domain-containing protein [Paraburkholderia sp. CNPSo 3155]|uniref:ABC transporter ATP-binding protein n=1 Tax=Paraburkholderia atlantica TaxID=2654982 RepID=UPI00128CD9E3|nr:ABC transporter ATP-binding protein [Paraburkholderia atlantica]MPW11164.1 ATP-binding cassette domain-containing protein [Paraburkholderia atlantica]
MNTKALLIDGLSAGYRRNRVLHDVTLHIDRGESVCLLGRNGVGKSTLASVIAGFLIPSVGSIKLDGHPVSHESIYSRALSGISLVPQTRRLFKSLTVRQNLEVSMCGVDRADQAWSIDDCFEIFPSLALRSGTAAGMLSGGEQQMLALARAMRTGPNVLILDEPIEGLSPLMAEKIGTALNQIRTSGTSILLIEQHIRFGLTQTDRTYVMSRGRIVAEGKSSDLLEDTDALKKFMSIGGA